MKGITDKSLRLFIKLAKSIMQSKQNKIPQYFLENNKIFQEE